MNALTVLILVCVMGVSAPAETSVDVGASAAAVVSLAAPFEVPSALDSGADVERPVQWDGVSTRPRSLRVAPGYLPAPRAP